MEDNNYSNQGNAAQPNQTEFLALYQQLCFKNEIKPNDHIILAIKRAPVSTSTEGLVLNLTNASVSAESAGILAECLSVDSCFDEVSFADCQLSEEALRAIIGGLRTNAFCRRLDLKGNGIRGRTVELLGSYLEHNESLKCLILEWNQLGMLEKSFAAFCDGLAKNSGLEILDLRNNQLNHECASDLAKVVRCNSSLTVIDLRWNTVGLLGARELLSGMSKNRTLARLDLTGNNVPQDLTRAIEIAAGHNEEVARSSSGLAQRSMMLSEQLNARDREQKREVSKLLTRLDNTESSMRQQSHRSHQRIQQLQSLLDEKKFLFSQQQAKLSLAESQLAVVETKYTELQKSLQQMLLDKEELIRSHALEMQRQREDRQQQEAGLRKEFDNLTVKCAQLEAQVADSEQRAEQLKAANLELREEVAAVQAEKRLRQAELDERLQTERQQCRDQLLEMESARDRELNQLRAEFESSDRAHRDRQARADRERADLESETARLRAQLQSEKLAAEEAQAGLRARLRAEEEQRVAALEERARLLQSGKEEAAGRAAALAAQLAEQQRAQAAQQAEVEAGKRRLEDAATQLAAARAEGHAEAARVRLEMQERLNSLEAERRSQKELHEEIASLKSELQRCRDESREQLAAKDTQLAVLQERLNARGEELRRWREDEEARAAALQTAVMQFCRRGGSAKAANSE
ncbi:hypothetical protein BOX15_Mlig003156g1 [Macrostomum lignano]|uniref:Uncharacterized protein n=2 Tax=Macrostomum lignano TaxID=282301 RepID=A0A267EZE4_9PLAT|nr:hypothetical protein BOX15_Mlig003156g1 [Macrostomum lignano]